MLQVSSKGQKTQRSLQGDKRGVTMEGLKPPATLNLQAQSLDQAWKIWKEKFNLYVDI